MSFEQERVQNSADHLYKAMSEFSNHLDRNGATLDETTKRLASVFDRETMVFLNQCNLHSRTVYMVKWNGQSTQLMGLLMTINGFMKQVTQMNGYKFSGQEWFNK